MEMTFDQVESEFTKAISHYCQVMQIGEAEVRASPEHMAYVARSIILVNKIGSRRRAEKVASPGQVHDTRSAGFQDVSGRRMTQREKVLDLLDQEPGMTREEVASRLKMRTSSATARISELLQSGDIHESGTKTGSAGLEQAKLFITRK